MKLSKSQFWAIFIALFLMFLQLSSMRRNIDKMATIATLTYAREYSTVNNLNREYENKDRDLDRNIDRLYNEFKMINKENGVTR